MIAVCRLVLPTPIPSGLAFARAQSIQSLLCGSRESVAWRDVCMCLYSPHKAECAKVHVESRLFQFSATRSQFTQPIPGYRG